jgi:hypothetical protein
MPQYGTETEAESDSEPEPPFKERVRYWRRRIRLRVVKDVAAATRNVVEFVAASLLLVWLCLRWIRLHS